MIGAAQPAFTHLQGGTPEAAWLEAGVTGLPHLDGELFSPKGGAQTMLLVGAAHPDDESLGAAGLVVSALAAGVDVSVLLCTRGEASHPESRSLSEQRLGELRRAEFDVALRELHEGAAMIARLAGRPVGRLDLSELGLPDGQLSAAVDEIAAAAGARLRDAPDRRLIVAAPYRRDGHADHDAVGEALARAALDADAVLLEFPIWFWHWADPVTDTEWRHWRSLTLAPEAARAKDRAISAHASQVRPLSDAAGDEPVLSQAHLQHFRRDVEVFRVTAPATRDSASARLAFDEVHADAVDPWELRSSWYERRKLDVLLAMLPAERYERGLEIGCSIGESTSKLAGRCSRLLAADASPEALKLAEGKLTGNADVELVLATLPRDWAALDVNDGQLDLVVLSETGYYLAEDELCELIARSRRALPPAGVLVLCHWRGPIVGWPLDGDRVHSLTARLGMRRLASYTQDETLIDIYENGSVAGNSCFASSHVTVPAASDLDRGRFPEETA
ncbi:LmbE family N-acetylglucosaminyl deacetylase [Pseudoclavibacter sp. JAI123]|uniref:bifunctional PIG-L family deacetylase/class I SAM-dependent methyltransferase n=1 Tax=Pseudoclavibacter sp. JAI123 TaxID=2723065 RepID=UPI0017C5EF9D|nr:bifunctional PIG-L family deacetylase/class I SAM-dependent methyltransferase [Pseudoclavibacter sp. JAI123]NYF13518.1 LmbE family N-acetylglucosaminyl deacetylase [Pseudoclavibacter sp. JAI123]